MEYDLRNLKMFQFDCPFDRLEERKARDLFGAILSLRKLGYLSHHAYGILPTDTYDFIGTHYGIYLENEEGIQVLTSYRTLRLDRCQEFNLAFPLEVILKTAAANEHLEVLKNLSQQAEQKSTEIIYSGSWTIAPKARENKDFFAKIYDMFFAMNILTYLDQPEPLRLACGSIRLKTVKPIQHMGYQYFEKNGEALGSFKQYNFNNEEVMALRLDVPSAEAIEKAKVYELLWRKREIIHRPETIKETIRKIA